MCPRLRKSNAAAGAYVVGSDIDGGGRPITCFSSHKLIPQLDDKKTTLIRT